MAEALKKEPSAQKRDLVPSKSLAEASKKKAECPKEGPRALKRGPSALKRLVRLPVYSVLTFVWMELQVFNFPFLFYLMPA